MRRVLLIFPLFTLLPLLILAQDNELDPYLRSVLERTAPEQELNLFVKGDLKRIESFCRSEGGNLKFQTGGFASLRLPSKKVQELRSKAYSDRILVQMGKGTPLNDTMRIRNRINPIQNGKGLPSEYQGSDVVLGYIDSGIDFDHPDFKDSTGRTRVLELWDQTLPDSSNTPSKYGYGQVWDSSAINAGTCPHVDQPGFYGHGSSVASVGSGNDNATGNHKGGAPKSDIVIVSNDFGAKNWTATIADGVDYILSVADSLGKPVVINTSVGTYLGPHDALDPAARMIDSLILQRDPSMLVAAAGNAGHLPFHLRTQVTSDTAFTWFEYESNTALGYGAVYFEVWADTSDFDSVDYAIGADRVNPSYLYRGRTPFHSVQNNLDSSIVDTLMNGSGDTLAIVETYAQRLGSRYKLQVHLKEPDSNQYYYRFMSTGSGKFDVWSAGFLGTSPMVDSSSIPDTNQFADIADYRAPDRRKTIVSSWTCSEEVLTVANYTGRTEYRGLDSNIQSVSGTKGAIASNSSRGPTRRGRDKPDIAATGKVLMTAGKLSVIDNLITNEPYKVHPDSMHMRNGGTSIASPVAASISALYLQHCPQADHQEVMQALRTTTRSDSFTGSLPNNRWGHGKVDGHAALSSSLFDAELDPSDTTVCGGPVELSTKKGYPSYLWNEGSSNAPLSIDSSGSYHALVRDSSACPARTDTADITVHPLPPTPTLYQQGDSLFTDLSGMTYQWYRDGAPITGATDQGYRIQKQGSFYLIVEDSNGCRNRSDTVNAIPSSISSQKGLRVEIAPNPFDEAFYLKTGRPLGKELRYRLRGIHGRILLSGQIARGRSEQRISTEELSPGAYILEWEKGDDKGEVKLLKR